MQVESVWNYPRPPRLETSPQHIEIVDHGIMLADTRSALRVLETSHPPVFYLPPGDLRLDLLQPDTRPRSFCEFKGAAVYWSLLLPDGQIAPDVAWSYPQPTAAFARLRDHLAFYASRVDVCRVDGELVQAQPGDFYGGWITSAVRGPFKGGPGTLGW